MAPRKGRKNKAVVKKGCSRGWRSVTLGGAALAMALANSVNVPPAYALGQGTLSGTTATSGTICATASCSFNTPPWTTTFDYSIGIGDLVGNLVNSGTIEAVDNGSCPSPSASCSSVYASAYGIYAAGNLAGSISNSGSISASATALNGSGTASADAYGISVGGNLSGTLNNSAMIEALAEAQADSFASAYAYGVTVDGELSGTLSNSGTISAEARAHSTNYSITFARAIQLNDISATGVVNNDETIKATALASNSNGLAFAIASGIEIHNLAGILTNSGSISATATALNDAGPAIAAAHGIIVNGGVELDGELSGTLSNSGTINAEARAYATTSSAFAWAIADGIGINSLSGSLTNSGSISATASALNDAGTATAGAYGISLFGNHSGILTNSGVIEAVAEAQAVRSASAFAYGVMAAWVGELSGTLSNSGTISAEARAYATTSSAIAGAVQLNDISATGVVNNNQTIKAAALASNSNGHASASASGIWINNLAGSLTNSGSISATATAISGVWQDPLPLLFSSGPISPTATAINSTGTAEAHGIRIAGNLSCSLINSGVIGAGAEAKAAGSATANAYGIKVDGELNGQLTNRGTIYGFAFGDHPEHGYSLYVNSGTGTINNEAGGVLYGNLSIGGAVKVDNQGTIDLPSRPIDLSPAVIQGDYNQGSTGRLIIGVVSTTNYAQLKVNGNATMAPGTGLVVNVADSNTLASGDTLADVLVAGSLSASNLVVTETYGLLDFTAVIDGNTIDLGVSRYTVAGSTDLSGNSGATGAATLFDQLFASNGGSGGMNDVLSVIWNDLGSAREVAAAIDSTLPILNGDMPKTIAGTKRGANRIIRARQAGQGMNSGDGFFADRNVWLKPFGSSATQDASNGSEGYDADSYGLIIGADGKVSDGFRLGLAFAYSDTDIDADGGVSREAEVTSYQGIVYASHELSRGTEFNWQVDYGTHANEISKSMPLFGRVAKADYDSWSAHAGAEMAKDFAVGARTSLTPSVRVDYTMIEDEGYTETGAGSLNLSVDKNKTDELILGGEGKLTHDFGGNFAMTANLGLGYDVLADDDSITASYAGEPSATFVTTGVDPSPWIYSGGLGVSAGSKQMMEFTVRYDIEGRKDFLDQSVSLKLLKSF
jgi:outer membrane autotransporter protein